MRFITGNKILRILKGKGMAPELPEDCYYLIKKAVSIRKHLERNRKDRDAKFRLILVESRIHRLARLSYIASLLDLHARVFAYQQAQAGLVKTFAILQVCQTPYDQCGYFDHRRAYNSVKRKCTGY